MDIADRSATAKLADWTAGRTAESRERPAAARCPRCGMGFRDTPPPRRRRRARPGAAAGDPPCAGRQADPCDDAGRLEILRCPDCGRRFWADPDGPGGHCTVGLVAEVRP